MFFILCVRFDDALFSKMTCLNFVFENNRMVKKKSFYNQSFEFCRNECTVYTTVREKNPIGGKLFFLIKIENFYQKKQLPSKETLPARLLSVAKNSVLYTLSSSMILKRHTKNASRFSWY